MYTDTLISTGATFLVRSIVAQTSSTARSAIPACCLSAVPGQCRCCSKLLMPAPLSC